MRLDPYVYPETNVLKNKFDIKNLDDLHNMEGLFYTKAQLKPLPEGKLDYAHLKSIHHHFFGEIYEWAGKERTVDIAKGDSFFCVTSFIDNISNKLFDQLKKDNYLKNLDESSYHKKMAHYFNEINAIHPFREGNGRALRAFFDVLGQQSQHKIHWENVDRKTYLNASIDGFNGSNKSMEAVFEQISVPISLKINQKKSSVELIKETKEKPFNFLNAIQSVIDSPDANQIIKNHIERKEAILRGAKPPKKIALNNVEGSEKIWQNMNNYFLSEELKAKEQAKDPVHKTVAELRHVANLIKSATNEKKPALEKEFQEKWDITLKNPTLIAKIQQHYPKLSQHLGIKQKQLHDLGYDI